MKTLLIVASVLGVAYAGVGTLSPQEEAEAIQLFERLCASQGGYGGGGGGESGQDIGGTLVYCKRGRDDRQETLNHNVNVQDNSRTPAQVVFVQPPPVRYQHRVLVQGGASQGQQTKVYVLPQQATHELTADYRGQGAQPVKPTVYFLKGGDAGSQRPSYGPPGQQAPPPSSNYGAPQQPGSSYGPPPSNGYSG